jgi:hypothetical protein
LVPPVPPTPCHDPTQGNAPYCNVLEWYVQYHPLICQNCPKCQVNKWYKHKYGKVPIKLVIRNPWEALCVDRIGPYTFKGKDGTEIDFMCLTMIDQATSWLQIIELPVVETSTISMGTWGHKGPLTHTTPKVPYFNKSSAMISTLVNKTWFSRYGCCQQVIYDNAVNSNFTSKTYVTYMA